jgi:AraC family transcriptional regulator, transcriptional activator of pobA
VPGSDIPSYVLYGEPYGSPFPDCLHCEMISDRSRQYDWHIRPHRHYGLHQFLWIRGGAVVVSSDAGNDVVVAPCAIMNAPTSVHGFEFEPETDGYAVTIPTVNLEHSIPGRSALIGRLHRSIVLRDPDLEDRSAVNSTFEALAAEYARREEGRTEALLCHAGLIGLWFLRCAARLEAYRRTDARPQIALVRRFLALVEDKFREQLPLSYYARVIDVTVPHLSRMCRRHLGLSALAVVHERVVLEAKRNLAYTPASIAHIADELGFLDPSYFTKFFAQHVGETPSAFRSAFLDPTRAFET